MLRQPIVVGVDASVESDRAVELAGKIATAARAPLVPVHAVPDLWLGGGLEGLPRLLPDVREALLRDGRTAMARHLENLLPPASRKRLELRMGSAPMAIAKVAHARHAALVVVGGKHHSALARGLGRSTAHYLIRALDVPLLVAGQSPIPPTRVLAAVDLSTASQPTLKAAERFAKLLQAQLRVIHVVEPLPASYFPVDALNQDVVHERSREAFDRLMKSARTVAPADRVRRTGIAAEMIAEETAAWKAELIVVGAHGKGWVDRLLIGSTTERLLTLLPASLLVIPTAARRRSRLQET